ncbi:MAG: cytochrome c [Leptospiraceae bacterium]|nr:cytochrome c [Leptospiraceae bacterium]MDW7975005.1 cytochrome c [Leptospiraceae bacterium]
MKDNKTFSIPEWIIYPAVGIFVFGLIVGAFGTLFSSKDVSLKYKEEAGVYIVKAKFDMVVPQRTEAVIAQGKILYEQACAACHLADMKGAVGPNLIDNEWRNPPAKETHLFKLVWNGIPNGNPPMPAKGGRLDFTSEQIWSILYYISSKNPKIERDAVPTQ